MQKRRWLFAVVLVFLTAVILCCFSACDGSYKNKEKLPLKPWQDYIVDVSRAIDLQYLGLSAQKPISVDIEMNALDSAADERYECSLLLNLDPTDREAQQGSLQIVKNGVDGRKILIDAYNEGDTLYLRQWQSEIGKYEQTRFDNAPLLYSLQVLAGVFGESIDYTTPGTAFEALAGVFFNDGSVNNADATEFVFQFDLKKGLQTLFARDMFEELPQVLQKVFFSIAGVESYEEMLDKTPSLKGCVNIVLKNKLIDRIYCDSLEYIDAATKEKRVVSIDMPSIRLSNSKIDMTSRMPDTSDYGSGRLSDVAASGKVTLENTKLGKTEMQYEYQFNAKVDLIELLAEGGDINKLKDDNYFHFRMTHKCDAECTAFCKDKYSAAKGAVLDVAFSPKDFGTHDIYVSLGARALLGANAVGKWTNLEYFAKQFLPEYVLAVIPSDTLFKRPSSTLSKEASDLKSIAEQILMALEYEDSAFSFFIDEMMKALGLDESIAEIVESIFDGDGYHIDTVNIKQEKLNWHAENYDVKRSAIHLYGKDVSGTKSYSTALINNPAVKYSFDANTVYADEKQLSVVDIHSGKCKDGIIASYTVPIGEEEIDGLIGSYVVATAEDIYGEIGNQNLLVVGHSAVDPTKRGWQEIELYCLPVGERAFEKLLWEYIRGLEWSKWLCHTVKTCIYIDNIESVIFVKPETTQYAQGAKFNANSRNLLDIEAKLTYASGKTKFRYVETDNADDLFAYDTNGNRYIKANGDVVLNYYLFGGYCGVKVKVTPAKTEKLITKTEKLNLDYNAQKAYSSELCIVYVRWEYDDGSYSEARLPLESLRINGYKLDEKNDYFYYSNAYTSDGVIFNKEGEYALTFVYGAGSVNIPLILTEKVLEDKSEYGIDLVSAVKDHYFVGYEYNFEVAIFNTYHGDLGKSEELRLDIRKAQLSGAGELTYPLSSTQDGFEIGRITLDSQDITLPYILELPPTVYGSKNLRVKIRFLQSGYYQLKFALGTKTCTLEIYVSPTDL